MEINVVGTSQVSKCHYDLKNPYFRYTGAAQPPAGMSMLFSFNVC